MMKRLLAVYSLFLVLVLSTAASPAAAQQLSEEQEIRQMLEQRDRQIKDILGNGNEVTGAQREELKRLINNVIDFREMGRQALGSHWEELSPEQREEFVETFADVVRAQSMQDLSVYRAEVTYETIDVVGDSAHVETTAMVQGAPTTVEYQMGRSNGEWRVHDIVLDDVSTVEGYQGSFRRVIARRGFDGLMETLERRREAAEEAQTG